MLNKFVHAIIKKDTEDINVMNVSFDIVIVVTISMSLKADASAMNDAGDGVMGKSVYDCRFWREPKQEIANMIMNNKKTNKRVFSISGTLLQ